MFFIIIYLFINKDIGALCLHEQIQYYKNCTFYENKILLLLHLSHVGNILFLVQFYFSIENKTISLQYINK